MAVATLNVKNFPDALYRKLQERAERDRRSVAQEVIHLVEQELEATLPLSLLQLRGLGAELWEGTDARALIDAERDSWD